MKELEKYYDPQQVEKGKDKFWYEHGYYSCDVNSKKKPFSVTLPPPNVTGILHIGHAKNTATTDMICRYKRLQGFDVLFAPGTDHAGIATQAKVEANLKKEGINKYDLGREKFLEKVWEWKEKSANYIHEQWGKLGLSLDYSRERFTLDEKTTEAVNHTFKTLYDQGLIYQKEKIINWDTSLMTALSNIEVIHEDIPGKFYYFKYRFATHPEDYLEVATTRPETMFGDTAVCFNPHDERYNKYEGEMVLNPANGEPLPLIGDRYVDKDFGTGVMKCTPAHDPNDFEVGKRHNLAVIKCMNLDGTMNEKAGIYQGQDRFVCRDNLVKKIEEQGDLIKIDEIIHSVGHSERSHTIVEPTLSKQWFVKMKPLAEDVIEKMKGKDKIQFFPRRFEKIFDRWLKTTEDWCISRQLWWGHRIPVYTNKETGEKICSETALDPKLYDQDPDVLDTWFSSALSPFALQNWPDVDDPYYKRYYPNDLLVTAYDIIFFWVARMAFQGVHLTGKLPFKNVFIHGLVRDEQGRKMSKSLGNGIDPIEVVEKYGADSLRYVVATNGTPGQDNNVGFKLIEESRTFLNKVWNAARFVLSLIPDGFESSSLTNKELSFDDKYIYHQFAKANKMIVKNMEKYELGQATKYLYDFVYDDYCGTYIELAKVELKHADEKRKDVIYNVLIDVLKDILISLFPTCPFITEEIYSYLPGHKISIYEESYPKGRLLRTGYDLGEKLVSIVKYIRAFKSENKISPQEKVTINIKGEKADLEKLTPFIKAFGPSEEIIYVESEENLRFFGNIGLSIKASKAEMSQEKIQERIAFLHNEIKRSEGLLNNKGFLAKAPEAKIKIEKEKYQQYLEELKKYEN